MRSGCPQLGLFLSIVLVAVDAEAQLSPPSTGSTICTTVGDLTLCSNGASVLSVDRDTQIYNPPTPRSPVPVLKPAAPPVPPWVIPK